MGQQRNVVGNSISGNRNFFSWLFRKSDKKTESGGHLMPLPEPIVGHSEFERIWASVTEPNAFKIGIHCEKIGSGLTTLVNYLNNRFIEGSVEYDYVIVCHSASSTHTIREKIASQIGISETEDWMYETDFNYKARMLLEALQEKKYVLLMDCMRGEFHPCDIGVPDPNEENQCKFIFTTPFEVVCDINNPDSIIKFKPLPSEVDPWSLFSQIVGEKKLSDSEICEIAMEMVKLCFGLPKVLVVVAGLMTHNKKLKQWQDDLDNMKNCHWGLKHDISRFKMDFAEDYYYNITFYRKLAAGQKALTSRFSPGLSGEEGKRLLAVRQSGRLKVIEELSLNSEKLEKAVTKLKLIEGEIQRRVDAEDERETSVSKVVEGWFKSVSQTTKEANTVVQEAKSV